eukprot:scaffold12434_cov177-Amphora_coffeaeformis.AAC.5
MSHPHQKGFLEGVLSLFPGAGIIATISSTWNYVGVISDPVRLTVWCRTCRSRIRPGAVWRNALKNLPEAAARCVLLCELWHEVLRIYKEKYS